MTEPIDEALGAWTKVFETVLGFATAHAESHLAASVSGGSGKPGPSGFQMSTDIRCEPGTKSTASTVTINVPAPSDDLAIEDPRVVHVVAGSMPAAVTASGSSAVLDAAAIIPAGDTTLVLGLPTALPRGLHIGHVTTPNGAKVAPIVLYIDDALT